jgi:integrase
VRAYRDALERAGRSPATVAKHLSALRGLADALGVEAQQLRTVRSARVGRGDPRALTHDEWQRLLRMPDRRTRQGKRDLALLHLLGSVGLRRAEAARLLVTDVDERRRASDPRLRQAIKGSTAWWAMVRYGKRGRTRAVPLDEDALDAIVAWVKSRPPAPTEHLLVSLPRTGQPGPLGTRDVAQGRFATRDARRANRADRRVGVQRRRELAQRRQVLGDGGRRSAGTLEPITVSADRRWRHRLGRRVGAEEGAEGPGRRRRTYAASPASAAGRRPRPRSRPARAGRRCRRRLPR